MNDNWKDSYNSKGAIYDAFSKYEDYKGKVWEAINKKVNFCNKKVFEMGCGTGKYTYLIAETASKVYANDISALMIHMAQEKCAMFNNIEYITSSAESVSSVPDHSVDIIFSAWGYVSTPHIARKVEEEFDRILKDNGEIILVDNYFEGEFTEMREKYVDGTEMCLVSQYGYSLLEIVRTAFEFPSMDYAKEICGIIFGQKALSFFDNKGEPTMEDSVAVLYKKKTNIE